MGKLNINPQLASPVHWSKKSCTGLVRVTPGTPGLPGARASPVKSRFTPIKISVKSQSGLGMGRLGWPGQIPYGIDSVNSVYLDFAKAFD